MGLFIRQAKDVVAVADLLTPAGGNLSFEIGTLAQGQASGWLVTSSYTEGHSVGLFDMAGQLAWDSAEGFEHDWQAPRYVHLGVDSNILVKPLAVTTAEAYALANEMLDKFNLHIEVYPAVHLAADVLNEVDAAYAISTATLIALVNEFKGKLNAHAANYPLVHRWPDTVHVVSTADAVDEGTAIALLNELATAYALHLETLTVGGDNSTALFAFSTSDTSAAVFHDAITYEGFEFGWDWPVALWPSGHVELLNVLENIYTQAAADGVPEEFEREWLLPGDVEGRTNDRFVFRYYNVEMEIWSFSSSQLQQGVTETFEAGWHENDTWFAKYWDGTKFRFLDDTFTPGYRHLFQRGFGVHTFGTVADNGTYTPVASSHPTYSPIMWVALPAATTFPSEMVGYLSYTEPGLSTQDVYAFCEATLPLAAAVDLNYFTADLLVTPTEFENQWVGVTAVQTFTVAANPPEGKTFVVRGTKLAVEDFSEEWILSFTL